MSQIKQPSIQVAANEINNVETENNISAIKIVVDIDRRINDSKTQQKNEELKRQNTMREESENINADSIREDMNREFID